MDDLDGFAYRPRTTAALLAHMAVLLQLQPDGTVVVPLDDRAKFKELRVQLEALEITPESDR